MTRFARPRTADEDRFFAELTRSSPILCSGMTAEAGMRDLAELCPASPLAAAFVRRLYEAAR